MLRKGSRKALFYESELKGLTKSMLMNILNYCTLKYKNSMWRHHRIHTESSELKKNIQNSVKAQYTSLDYKMNMQCDLL